MRGSIKRRHPAGAYTGHQVTSSRSSVHQLGLMSSSDGVIRPAEEIRSVVYVACAPLLLPMERDRAASDRWMELLVQSVGLAMFEDDVAARDWTRERRASLGERRPCPIMI
ncbi:hypothetical protein PR202_ga12538 [Eleusine coracana subsp. coracana]|uniref:Uncharacterized protein n=1 Tax=Eleusine coracana subsp. coracana TaxID=191504 RepID=A0AAV5CC71_ELECO|nr:hypothetical protein PR202_ga12538 [Eleusine coracana subsp. coracana]